MYFYFTRFTELRIVCLHRDRSLELIIVETGVITRTHSSYQKTVAFSGGLLRKNSNAAGQSHMHSQHVQAKLACTGQQSRSMIQIENELRCKHIHGINETILFEAKGSVREFSRKVESRFLSRRRHTYRTSIDVEAFRKQRGKVFNGVCASTTRTPRNLKDKNFNMSHKLRIFHGLLEKLRQD